MPASVRHISELHAFHGDEHCFVGTLNEQATLAELLVQDSVALESCRKGLGMNTQRTAVVGCGLSIWPNSENWTLLMVDGKPFLGFVRFQMSN